MPDIEKFVNYPKKIELKFTETISPNVTFGSTSAAILTTSKELTGVTLRVFIDVRLSVRPH